MDVAIAYRLVRRVTHGKSLSRRERRMLIRTFNDLLRLVPFLIFMLVPFMEFLLPFAIRLFPNMLPSTFQEKHDKEENLKKRIKLQLELADFLQDSMERFVSKKQPGSDAVQNMLMQIREGGKVDVRMTADLAKYFSNDLTFENVPVQQLLTICRSLNITPRSTRYRGVIMYQLDQKLRALKSDDEEIFKEGINSLTNDELKAALKERGLRTVGVGLRDMKKQLSDWLELSIEYEIPAGLIVVSQALNSRQQGLSAIQETLQNMDTAVVDNVIHENFSESNETNLEFLKREEMRIDKERQAAEKRREEDEEMLEDVTEAISMASARSALEEEKEKLRELVMEESKLDDIRDELIKSRDKVQTMLDAAEDEGDLKNVEALRLRLRKMHDTLKTAIDSAELDIGLKFRLLDLDQDGVITYEEVRDFLIHSLRAIDTEEEVLEIWSHLDLKNDGILDKGEIEQLISQIKACQNAPFYDEKHRNEELELEEKKHSKEERMS